MMMAPAIAALSKPLGINRPRRGGHNSPGR